MHQRHARLILGLLAAALSALAIAIPAAEPAGAPSGPIFTAAQADRGLALYAAQCANCHGASLQGGSGLPLTGTAFQSHWANRPLRELSQVITEQMPQNAPGSLSESQVFDLLAFIFHQNHYAPGVATLDNDQLYVVLFEGGTAPAAPNDTAPMSLPGTPAFYGRARSSRPDDAELQRAADAQWLMYNRDYQGQRYSGLRQINARTAARLHAVCAFQLGQVGWYPASPVIYDGTLYVTATSSTYAIDAATCRQRWRYDYVTSDRPPLLSVNRGVAIYRGALYRSTPTGHLIALDTATGRLLWDERVSDTASGHWLGAAPIVYDGKVFMGEAGADAGANGHVHAFDAATGARLWTFDLVPTGSQAGADTWQQGAATGGGSTWTSYSLDPAAHVLYVPVGNPTPDFAGAARPGSNLFSDSVLALDTDTGHLIWYAQQSPHDTHDWDTSSPPALYTLNARRYLSVASKNGLLYLYDRDTHQLLAQQEVTTRLNVDKAPTREGVRTCPGNMGGVEWFGPTYSPRDQALYVNSVDWCGRFVLSDPHYQPGMLYLGGQIILDPPSQAGGWIRRYNAATGSPVWTVRMATPMLAGLTATAGNVIMTGDLNGDFLVLRSSDGTPLYRFNTGGAVAGGVSTYEVGRKQYVAVASGNASRATWGTSGAASIFVFALP